MKRMKTLLEYLNKAESLNILFEDIEQYQTIQDVYEALGYKLLEDEMLCEGLGSWLRKLADKGDKIDSKATELKNAAKEKMDKLSDAGKAALKKIKAEAGEKWDNIKDVYTATIATVDNAIQTSKDTIVALAKRTGQKIEDIEASLSTVYTNAISKGTEFGKKIGEWAADKTNGAQMIAAVSTFTLAALIAHKAGLDSSLLMDIMTNAGIK